MGWWQREESPEHVLGRAGGPWGQGAEPARDPRETVQNTSGLTPKEQGSGSYPLSPGPHWGRLGYYPPTLNVSTELVLGTENVLRGGRQRAAVDRLCTGPSPGVERAQAQCQALATDYLIQSLQNPTRQLLSLLVVVLVLVLLPLYSWVDWGSKRFSSLPKIPALGQCRSRTSEQMLFQLLQWPPWWPSVEAVWKGGFYLSRYTQSYYQRPFCYFFVVLFFYYKHVFPL